MNAKHLSFAHVGIEGRCSSHPLFKMEVLPFSAQISISSWQITGEKSMQPGDRQKINSFMLSSNMMCHMFQDILFQHYPISLLWNLCSSFRWLQAYNEVQAGSIIKNHQQRPLDRDFLSAMFLVQPGCYLQSDNERHPACLHWFSEKAPPFQKIHKTKVSILILLWWFLLCCWLRLIRI